MADYIKVRYLETYALITNVDNSVQRLNPIIEEFGYKFVVLKLDELEKQFFNLFSSSPLSKPEEIVGFSGSSVSISNEFYNSLINTPFGSRYISTQEVILLKRIELIEQRVLNNTFEISLNEVGEMQEFTSSLLQQLRLFKKGDISCELQFQIITDSRHVLSKSTGRVSLRNEIYSLTENEVSILKLTLQKLFKSNDLTSLAIENFNLSYETRDSRTAYITLMSSLESIFNHSHDQISHTISRHLAIITSITKEEFEDNYIRYKKFYALRSKIVHGANLDVNLHSVLEDIKDLTRTAINYCLQLTINKKELFYLLNAKGFSN